MKKHILFITTKGLTVLLTIFLWVALLFSDFVWAKMDIIIVPMLILNTMSLLGTILSRINLGKTIYICFLLLDILVYFFLVYYLRLFLAFENT